MSESPGGGDGSCEESLRGLQERRGRGVFAEQQERLLQDGWGDTAGRRRVEVKQNQAALDHVWVGERLRGRDNNLSVKERATAP